MLYKHTASISGILKRSKFSPHSHSSSWELLMDLGLPQFTGKLDTMELVGVANTVGSEGDTSQVGLITTPLF